MKVTLITSMAGVIELVITHQMEDGAFAGHFYIGDQLTPILLEELGWASQMHPLIGIFRALEVHGNYKIVL
jgi:hypothetical protein